MSNTLHIALMASLALPASSAAPTEVPDWIHLLPAGTVLTHDGRGPYHVESLQAVIAASGSRLPVDENHAIDIAAQAGQPSPARGHITALEARADGIWGRVEWTASGRALLADHAYLGISPVITHDPQGRVQAILRASLTNRPNLKGLTTLHHQETTMPLAERLAQLLGLASASEDQLVERVTALHQSQTTATALQSSLGQIGVALGVPQDARPEAVIAAARAAGKTGTDLVPALQSQVTTLETALQAIQTERARDRATAFIDAAKSEGRVGVTQANRDELIAMHMANPASTEKLVNGFPKIAPGAQPQAQAVALQSDSRDLVARARKHQADQQAAGHDIGWAQAVRAVSEGAQ